MCLSTSTECVHFFPRRARSLPGQQPSVSPLLPGSCGDAQHSGNRMDHFSHSPITLDGTTPSVSEKGYLDHHRKALSGSVSVRNARDRGCIAISGLEKLFIKVRLKKDDMILRTPSIGAYSIFNDLGGSLGMWHGEHLVRCQCLRSGKAITDGTLVVRKGSRSSQLSHSAPLKPAPGCGP